MKLLLIVVPVFFLAGTKCMGQDFSELVDYKFKSASEYEEKEEQVLICANYLFDHPVDKNDMNRLVSMQFIIQWMSGTPDHTFSLGKEATDLTKGNADLLGLYMAAMSKVVLENEGAALNDTQISQQATELLLNYCENPDNNLKPSKKMKQLLKSK
jgi:hypothetical protein